MANTEIEYTENTRGDFSASINLNKLYPYVTGGSVYAYGDTKQDAHNRLLMNIEELIQKLKEVE